MVLRTPHLSLKYRLLKDERRRLHPLSTLCVVRSPHCAAAAVCPSARSTAPPEWTTHTGMPRFVVRSSLNSRLLGIVVLRGIVPYILSKSSRGSSVGWGEVEL